MNTELAVLINKDKKFGRQSVQVSQALTEYQSYRNKNAAFKAWLNHLNKSDKLPRGKFFIGKKPKTTPIIFMDEAHLFLGGNRLLK